MADVTRFGLTGLKGWREKVGDAVAAPLSQRTSLSEDQVRALLGAAFFALAVKYVVSTASDVAKQARGT